MASEHITIEDRQFFFLSKRTSIESYNEYGMAKEFGKHLAKFGHDPEQLVDLCKVIKDYETRWERHPEHKKAC
jgi:hypothetical protein